MASGKRNILCEILENLYSSKSYNNSRFFATNSFSGDEVWIAMIASKPTSLFTLVWRQRKIWGKCLGWRVWREQVSLPCAPFFQQCPLPTVSSPSLTKLISCFWWCSEECVRGTSHRGQRGGRNQWGTGGGPSPFTTGERIFPATIERDTLSFPTRLMPGR